MAIAMSALTTVAHPPDQRLLDLHHDRPLDAGVGQDPLEREAETEPADEHRRRFLDELECLRGELDLAGRLQGVHHEHAVDAELEHVGAGPGRTPSQHHLAAGALRAGDLHARPDVVRGLGAHHGAILPSPARTATPARARVLGQASSKVAARQNVSRNGCPDACCPTTVKVCTP
jgi:hypothetical protein